MIGTEMRDDHTVVRERRGHVDAAFCPSEGLNEVCCRKIRFDFQALPSYNASALSQNFFEQGIGKTGLLQKAEFLG